MSAPTLAIDNLDLSFKGLLSRTQVLHGVTLTVEPGERVALVGESGSGKSVLARLVLGLLQDQRGVEVSGRIDFAGTELDQLSRAARRALRGRDMSMIFQDPTSSLNPMFTIGNQFHAVLQRRETDLGGERAHETARSWLDRVAIPDTDRVLASYPFQLSGGMNQRVMIAMALANNPSLLLADEPGTALDVTVQAQTLELMRKLAEDVGTAVLFISHNLGVVREFADRVYVIHRGHIVESGQTADVFGNPGHPYTRALLAAIPRITGEGIPDLPEQIDLSHPPVHHNTGSADHG